MRIELSSRTDYPDVIELWVLGLYIHMYFYPIECWYWEWSVKTKLKPRPAIRLKFPSFTLHIVERY